VAEDNFDTEIEEACAHLERKLRKEFAAALADLEKRMLLKDRTEAHCRICSFGTEHGLNPPLSELERTYHEGNHGKAAEPDRSRGLPGLSPATDWDRFEKEVAARRRR
jgi:hypothetical protein